MSKPATFYCSHRVANDLAAVFGDRFQRLTANEKYRLLGLLGLFGHLQFDGSDIDPETEPEVISTLIDGCFDDDSPAVNHFIQEVQTHWPKAEFELQVLRPLMLTLSDQLNTNVYADVGCEMTDDDIDNQNP